MRKRVLIIAPKFFGIIRPLLEHLKNQGIDVDFKDDRFNQGFFYNFILRYFRSIYFLIFRNRVGELIGGISGDYNAILLINAEGLDQIALQKLTLKSKTTSFYTWDSVANKPYLANFFALQSDDFRVATFDPVDAKVFGVKYLPIFGHMIQANNIKHQYDASFIGTMHSGRLKFLRNFTKTESINMKNVYFRLLCRNYLIYFFYLILNIKYYTEFRKYVRVGNISYEEFLTITAESNVVLDYAHPSQSGLTHRSVLCLFNGKNIISNNRSCSPGTDDDSGREFTVLDSKQPYGILSVGAWLNEMNI